MSWVLGLYLFGLFPAFYFAARWIAHDSLVGKATTGDEALFVIVAGVLWPLYGSIWLLGFLVGNTKAFINSLIAAEREKIEGDKNAGK